MDPRLAQRHPSTQAVLQYFDYGHLPLNLQVVSGHCRDLAYAMVSQLPDSPELTVGLRKLLEAKDAFVRCAVSVPDAAEPRST